METQNPYVIDTAHIKNSTDFNLFKAPLPGFNSIRNWMAKRKSDNADAEHEQAKLKENTQQKKFETEQRKQRAVQLEAARLQGQQSRKQYEQYYGVGKEKQSWWGGSK